MSKTTGVKIGAYYYNKSNRQTKKLMTQVNGKTIHFGSKSNQHYKDKTGLLPISQSHNDPVKRQAYIARHSKIVDKNGKKVINDPNSPSYHSKRILW